MGDHYISWKIEDSTTTSHYDTYQVPPGFTGVPSLTIHAVAPGAVLSDETTSTFGHVFLTARTYVGGVLTETSIGFSPGADYLSSSDNISFNDSALYTDTSTHSIYSGNQNFLNSLDTLVGKIQEYKDGDLDPPNYDLLLFNCVDFVEGILQDASINMDLGFTPDDVLDRLETIGEAYITPLVIDLDGNGVETIAVDEGVRFDFDGDGTADQTGWVGSTDGFLAVDRNGDGKITNGSELFGQHTRLADGSLAQDGYEALRYVDSNQDGVINGDDEIWASLRIWRDANHNGETDDSELLSLDYLGIAQIDTGYWEDWAVDSNQNIHGTSSYVEWENGDITIATDVWFKQTTSGAGSECAAAFADLIGQNDGTEQQDLLFAA